MQTCLYCKVEYKPFHVKKLQHTCGDVNCRKQHKNKWARENPQCKINWVLRNPETRKAVSAKYQKENSSYYNQYARLYSANKTKARPSASTEWDDFVIDQFYDIAKKRGLEVDHIIPLKHKNVCGLHVPVNLHLLTRNANAKKSNKFCDEDVLVIWSKE